MDRRTFATTALASAVGLAAAVTATEASAAMSPEVQTKLNEMLKMYPHANKALIEKTMQRMAMDHLVRCYGINAVGRNDCAAGAHSCAGQATIARDPKSFVLLPVGDCEKIAGGHLKSF
ncbi:MAG: BufA1 family periplasmic bufferin-type metallophore [Acetobacteraceae bacterium]